MDDKTVLNFGCGGSNIAPQLEKSNINANIVDLDLKFDPVGAGLTIPIIEAINCIRSKVDKTGKLYEKLSKIRQQVGKIENRTFINADGRKLPFKDQTFDISLALWSIYQIPDNAKETVFEEIMRVSKIIHIAPIFKKDYQLLRKLSKELHFEVVVCHPFTLSYEEMEIAITDSLFQINDVKNEFKRFLNKIKEITKKDTFEVRNNFDYEKYIVENEPNIRIIEPEEENSKIFKIFGVPVLATGQGGSFIILKRH